MRVLTPVTGFEIIFLLDIIVSLDSEFIVLRISASHQEEQKSVANSFFCNFVICLSFDSNPPTPHTRYATTTIILAEKLHLYHT